MKRHWILVLALVVIGGAVLGRRLRMAPVHTETRPSHAPIPEEKVSTPAASSFSPAPRVDADLREGALRVRVAGEEGPLAGTSISVLSEDRAEPARKFATQADGTQEMHGIPVGEYTVYVKHAGYIPQGSRVAVQAGRIAEGVFRLKKGAEIKGRVSDAAGRPLEGTAVALLNPRNREVVLAALAEFSGPDGGYRISGIPSGEYLLDFRHPLHRPLQKEGVILHSPDDRLMLDVVLVAGTSLTGRVIDERGQPIVGAFVVAVNEESCSAKSGPGGRFALHGLGDGRLTLRAEASGFGIVFVPDLRPGTADIDVRLPPAAVISGRVVADPLPPAFGIRLWKYETDLGKELGQQYYAKIQETGEFTVPNIGPGEYRLEVVAEGYEPLEQPTLTLLAGRTISDLTIRMRRKP